MHQDRPTTYSGAKPRTCLIVEDDAFDRERMRRILAKSFPDIIVAMSSSIKEARAHMERFQTSVILLDNHLPDGTGANFAMEIRNKPEFSTIPVVIVSDWPTPFMYGKADSAGVIHVVSKSDFGARFIHAALGQKPTDKRAN